MTFREKLAKEYPDYVDEEYWGGCRYCPSDYGYETLEDKLRYCEDCSTERNCRECWGREIPETEENKTSSKIADDIADVFHGLLDRSIEQEKAYHIVRDLINRGYFDK